MPPAPDVIVVGLGAMGSAAAYALAQAGRRVLGLDRFSPPHALGSSHGRTRIIREAYFEHPAYVPLVRRAYEAWRDIERASGRTLFIQTRGVTIGAEDTALVTGALASAREHDIPHRVLTAEALQRRFPALAPGADMIGVLEDRAGVLFPEQCIAAALELAERHGAELRRDEPVTGWDASGDHVRVRTARGEYRAEQAVIAAGAWVAGLVPELAHVLRVERQPIHWFDPVPGSERLGPDRCPVTLWEYAPGRVFYTLPDFGDGLKAAIHYEGEPVSDPAVADRTPRAAEATTVRELLRQYMPHAAGRLRESQVCLYTNTPDLHFIIDRHPAYPERVVVLSPCSGHGFKFASAVGELAAELLATGTSRYDLSMFAADRFRPH